MITAKGQNILNSPCFAIEKRFADVMLLKLANVLKVEDMSYTEMKQARLDMMQETAPIIAIKPNANSSIEFVEGMPMSDVPAGSIAVIRIKGFISQDGDWCMKGLSDYTKEMQAAGGNKNIKGVVLMVNSGGGSVNGVEVFSNLVGSFESQYGKPLVALVDSTADSAAYFIISQAPRIMLDGEMAECGSIGTMVTLSDYSGYLEAMGIKEIEIFATKSFNKNKPYFDAKKGDTSGMVEWLDKYNDVFLKTVERGRSGKLNTSITAQTNDLQGNTITVPEVLTGKVYVGREVVQMGLADEISSLQGAVNYIEQRAAQMGLGNGQTTIVEVEDENEEEGNGAYYNQKINNITMFKNLSNETLQKQSELAQSQLNAIATEKGVGSQEYSAKAAEVEALEREIDYRNIKAANSELSQSVANLQASLSEKDSEISALQSQLEAAQNEAAKIDSTQVEQLQTQNSELAKQVEQLQLSVSQLEQKQSEVQNELLQVKAEKEAYANFLQENGMETPIVAVVQTAKNDGGQPEPITNKVPVADMTTKEQQKAALEAFYKNRKPNN